MEDLANILGIIGAYFAVLLVLAVAVETILEPIKLFEGLRKKVSPEQALKDVKDWLPEGSDANSKAISIANFMSEYKIKKSNLLTEGKEFTDAAKESLKAFGMTDKDFESGEHKLAEMLAELRKQYAQSEEKRIKLLRLFSGIAGVAIALLLQIDTFVLLGDLTKGFLESVPEGMELIVHYGGMVITGVAASAGSSFWHDQLGRIRAVKETAQQVKETTKELQNTLKIEVSNQPT